MTDTLDSLFAEARSRFLQAHIGEAAIDARVLISGLLDLPAVAFMTRGGEIVSEKDAQLFARRLNGVRRTSPFTAFSANANSTA